MTLQAMLNPARLSGTVRAVSSKSHMHRSMICAAFCRLPTLFFGITRLSQDVQATIGCLQALGAHMVPYNGDWLVIPAVKVPEEAVLDCRESGSTLRFLLPVAAAVCQKADFIGCGRLPQRPITQLMQACANHGMAFSAPSLPFTVTGRLQGGDFTLPGNVSSQYISGLLLAAPLTGQQVSIHLTTPLQSAAYVDMTVQAMRGYGVAVQRTDNGFSVVPGQRYRTPVEVTIEGDWSSAAFFLAAGALGGPVTVQGLSADSLQGDRTVLSLLQQMGACVSQSDDGITVCRGTLRGIEVDMAQIPDLLPPLAVMAAAAEGQSRFYNAGRLRLKETDRLNTLCRMLTDLGADVRQQDDALIVTGKPQLSGGNTDSFGDHRIAMAAAVASGICRGPVIIDNAACTTKSYPGFYDDYRALGGDVHGI